MDGAKRSGVCRAGARVVWCVSGCDSDAPRKATPTQATGTRSGHTSGGEATQNRNKEDGRGPVPSEGCQTMSQPEQAPSMSRQPQQASRSTCAARATWRASVTPTPPPTRRPPPPSRPDPGSTRARWSKPTHRHATPRQRLVPKRRTACRCVPATAPLPTPRAGVCACVSASQWRRVRDSGQPGAQEPPPPHVRYRAAHPVAQISRRHGGTTVAQPAAPVTSLPPRNETVPDSCMSQE